VIMMKRFAVIGGSIVTNVVMGESLEEVSAVVGPCIELTEETLFVGINWAWDGTTFTPPQDLPAV